MKDKIYGYTAWYNDDELDYHIYGIGRTVDEALEDARKNGWTIELDRLFIDALTEKAYWDLHNNGGDDLEDYRIVARDGDDLCLYDIASD